MPLYEPRDAQQGSIIEGDADEYTRTHTNMSKDKGDSPSFEKLVDPRLPKLFKFEYGGQDGWIVIPKGRIVSVVPDRTFKNFQDNKYYPGITLANGGQEVTEANDDPQSDEDNYTRVSNKPVGVAHLNVYQDLEDQFAGNRPGFITRNTINLPLFTEQELAEDVEWGSAYGALQPGDKVKSDANGRFVKWEEHKTRTQVFSGDGTQTSFQVDYSIYPDGDITVTDTDAGSEVNVSSITPATGTIELGSAPNSGTDNVEIEYQSVAGDDFEQLVGEVLMVDENLVPAGWLKWVMPEGEYQEPTGFNSGDLTDEGYPYDPSYGDFDKQKPTGIPGLTDGSNIIKEYSASASDTDPVVLDTEITDAWTASDEESFTARLDDEYLPVEEILALEIGNDSDGFTDIADGGYTGDTSYTFDKETGLLRVDLDTDTIPDNTGEEYVVRLSFTATHQYPGMPSHIDFNGVKGSVDILLQL